MLLAGLVLCGCTGGNHRRNAAATVLIESARSADVMLLNNTGQAVSGLRVQAQDSTADIHFTLTGNAAHCNSAPERTEADTGRQATFRWPAACVQPGDSVTLSLYQVFTVTEPRLGSATWLLNGQPVATP